ncbi:ABC transporter ATP-binding protein [Candidimonas nitroreducens]|uniref:Peptide ABC transporter ATP-binding protein n=1 Tax=Candidimonas nitroreducens TaxID=683354 RepID=A0A225MJ75_9BURK|nr:ABC transporter ATP-binding protein [Candidimonas nitroreducens]OWT58969.1 peptide ABC transporter ATP-binding protein [Candidimonas nitroreducens]
MKRDSFIATVTNPVTGTPAEPVLRVDGLQTYFFTRNGLVKAVDGVSFQVHAGETLAIVGESGCGKSMTALSVMRLVQSPPGRTVGGTITLDGKDLLGLSEEEMRQVRGNEVSMIFQEPMTSLNPVITVGDQIAEAIVLHQPISKRAALQKAVEMLKLVRIPEAERRAREYPHQLSGGMRQRVMTAMALACNPKVLLADEPTTALDVTIQAQVLALMKELQEQFGTAIVLITHDLGVVAENAQHVIVMYAGKKIEEAPVAEIFERPLHPYTRGLINAVPRLDLATTGQENGRLQEIPGIVPALIDLPDGCTFAPRCAHATDICRQKYPPFEEKSQSHYVACWHSEKLYGEKCGYIERNEAR